VSRSTEVTAVEGVGPGTAVSGVSYSSEDGAAAIYGELSSTSPGEDSSAVRGTSLGTNGNGIGVYGSTEGSGLGMYAYSASGTGLYALGAQGVLAVGGLFGVLASSEEGTGVRADGYTTGVEASGPTAVSGVSDSTAIGANAIYGQISSTSPGGGSGAVRGENRGTGALGIGVFGSQNGSGWGVYGFTPSGVGVYGYSAWNLGVRGVGASGVQADGSNVGLAASGSIGVSALGNGPTGIAVSASASSSLPALAASNGGSGPAVRASNPGGVALQVKGIAQFTRSGVATIPATTKQVVVSLPNVVSSSIVLATLQQVVNNVLVAGVVVGVGQFTIVLNRATPVPVRVGWFVIG
jgi:hypothetical protein